MTSLSARRLFFLLVLSAILIILPVSSFMENSTATINMTVNHYVGDKFTITGSTNLAVGNDLLVEIYSSSFKPTQKVQSGEFSGSSGTVTVRPGTSGYNVWSFDVDTSTFKPDEYIIKVSGITNDVMTSSSFTIHEPLPPASVPTVQATTLQTASPITPIVSPPPATTNKSPPSLVTVLIAFGFVGCAIVLKRK